MQRDTPHSGYVQHVLFVPGFVHIICSALLRRIIVVTMMLPVRALIDVHHLETIREKRRIPVHAHRQATLETVYRPARHCTARKQHRSNRALDHFLPNTRPRNSSSLHGPP